MQKTLSIKEFVDWKADFKIVSLIQIWHNIRKLSIYIYPRELQFRLVVIPHD